MDYTDFARNTIGLVSFVIRNVVVLYGGNGIRCFLSQILFNKGSGSKNKSFLGTYCQGLHDMVHLPADGD